MALGSYYASNPAAYLQLGGGDPAAIAEAKALIAQQTAAPQVSTAPAYTPEAPVASYKPTSMATPTYTYNPTPAAPAAPAPTQSNTSYIDTLYAGLGRSSGASGAANVTQAEKDFWANKQKTEGLSNAQLAASFKAATNDYYAKNPNDPITLAAQQAQWDQASLNGNNTGPNGMDAATYYWHYGDASDPRSRLYALDHGTATGNPQNTTGTQTPYTPGGGGAGGAGGTTLNTTPGSGGTADGDLTLDNVTPFVPPTLPAFNLQQPTFNPTAYAAPTYTAPTYTPNPVYLPSGQLNTLLDENSEYLQQARKQGERTMQSRGLLNSSLAAGAAEGAAMDRAYPIAKANADVYTAAGQAGYESALQAALKTMDAETQHNLTVLTGKINSDLSYQNSIQSDYLNQRSLTLQGMISSGISAQEAEQTLRQIEYQGMINQGLSDSQAKDKLDQINLQAANALVLDQQQQYGANYRTEIERDLNLDKLDAASREAISTAMTNYGIQFQQDVSNIQMDTKTSGAAKTAKIAVAQKVYETNMNNIAKLYDVPITWELPTVDTSTGTDTGTSTNTTTPANPIWDILPTEETRTVFNPDGTITKFIGYDKNTGEPIYQTK